MWLRYLRSQYAASGTTVITTLQSQARICSVVFTENILAISLKAVHVKYTENPHVAVDVRLAGLAPELLEGLTNVRQVAPEKVELSCRISTGVPSADIHWYRSRKLCKMFREIFNDEKYEIRRDGDTMTLIIAVSEATDSATYRCEAVNKFGKVRTESSVVLLRTSPRFLSTAVMEFVGMGAAKISNS